MSDPPVKPRRAYNSEGRRRQAEDTRRRIVAAATALFADQGYPRTSVKEIAAAASVSPETVYATFGSKVRVLTAAIDAALAPGGEDNVLETARALAVRDEPDPRRKIALFAEHLASINHRARPFMRMLRQAAVVEQGAGAVLNEMEANRLRNMTGLATWLDDAGALGLPVQKAGEVVWALASPQIGEMLCDERGWTESEHAEWLARMLTAALLEAERPSPGRAPRRRREP